MKIEDIDPADLPEYLVDEYTSLIENITLAAQKEIAATLKRVEMRDLDDRFILTSALMQSEASYVKVFTMQTPEVREWAVENEDHIRPPKDSIWSPEQIHAQALKKASSELIKRVKAQKKTD